jgi:hypothetical protein
VKKLREFVRFKNITITSCILLYTISITQFYELIITFFFFLYKIFILPALGLCCLGRPHQSPTPPPSPATPLARCFSAREGVRRNTIHCSVNEQKVKKLRSGGCSLGVDSGEHKRTRRDPTH